MIACLILGIGVPTTANYVITATLVAPAIVMAFPVDTPQFAASSRPTCSCTTSGSWPTSPRRSASRRTPRPGSPSRQPAADRRAVVPDRDQRVPRAVHVRAHAPAAAAGRDLVHRDQGGRDRAAGRVRGRDRGRRLHRPGHPLAGARRAARQRADAARRRPHHRPDRVDDLPDHPGLAVVDRDPGEHGRAGCGRAACSGARRPAARGHLPRARSGGESHPRPPRARGVGGRGRRARRDRHSGCATMAWRRPPSSATAWSAVPPAPCSTLRTSTTPS
jgi:hypothetical protein